jgi:hypothetical protein
MRGNWESICMILLTTLGFDQFRRVISQYLRESINLYLVICDYAKQLTKSQ